MVVADTDVVSYLFKRHPLATRYLELLTGHSVAVSFMTVAEIEYGVESDGWGEARRAAMRQYVESRFSARAGRLLTGMPGLLRPRSD